MTGDPIHPDFSVLGTALGLLVAMEIGDKTQLVVLSLTATTRRGFPVFLGAVTAFVVLSLLAVAVGGVVVALLPSEWLGRLAGTAFILLGVFLLWSTRPGSGSNEADEVVPMPLERGSLRIGLGVFGLLLAAEMGDKSQLSLVTLTARTGHPVEVFLGGVLGLTGLTLLTVLVGNTVAQHVPALLITRVAAAAFILIGLGSLWMAR